MEKHFVRVIRLALVGAALLAGLGAMGCCKKPEPKKQFGETCANNLDCENLTCTTYGNICTKSCQFDSDCGGDLVCREADIGAGDQCAKNIGTASGGSCMNASECSHGHCLKKVDHENDPGFCSQHCKTGADCPAGFKACFSISDSGDEKFCLPGDEKTTEKPQVAAPKKKAATPGTTSTVKPTATATATATASTPAASAKPAGSAPPASSAKPAATSTATATATGTATLKPPAGRPSTPPKSK